MKKESKERTEPKGETPFGRFRELAKKIVAAPKRQQEHKQNKDS